MSNNSLDNNNISKDLTSQTHSTEPSINILSKLNSIANENFHQIIPPIVCEICYKAANLIICEICKNGYHKKCLEKVFLPEPFICSHCKKQFTEEEISSILNNPYNQSHLQRKGILDAQKIYKEPNKKFKKKINTFINPTKIIELNEDNDKDNNSNNNIINNNLKEKNKDKNNDNNDNNIYLNKKKNNKKINDINLIENMNDNDGEDNYEKSENKSVRKEIKNKIKIDNDKNGGEGGGGENDNYESSIMSKSQEITLDKSNLKNKKRKKEKDNNSVIKTKSHSNHRNNSPSNNNIKISSINNNDIKSNKDKNNKEELSLYQSQSLSSKKNTKKKHFDNKNEKEQNILLSLTHTDPQYKRRKIKIGTSRQCNMYEFTDKYENKINFEEEEYERNDLVQVWSVEKNPLSEEELNNYMNTARLFWNYRNIHIEEDLCADFFLECEQKMKNKKILPKLKNKITKLIKELKELIKRGINLNSHYDEMSLRVLHLCKYKANVALLFLYKGLNPFIEEIEEGFKHDIYFFQDEIYSFINNGDFFDSDN